MAYEFEFPVDVIKLIQSYLDETQAFETRVLSKSWYTAWSTIPCLYFGEYNWGDIKKNEKVRNFARKTFERYRRLNLKLEKLKYRMYDNNFGCNISAYELIEDALKLGICELDLSFGVCMDFPFPVHVFASGSNLTKLSLTACVVHQLIDNAVVLCPHLLSLTLSGVRIGENCIDNILLGCPLLENLDISCNNMGFIRFKDNGPRNYPNLRFLRLRRIDIHDQFFKKFSFKFPCIENLSLANCRPTPQSKYLQLSSHSLKYLSLEGQSFEKADFDFPNICKFVYDADYRDLSEIKFSAVTREWESHVKVNCWFHISEPCSRFMQALRRCLIDELSRSKIFLSLHMRLHGCCCVSGTEIGRCSNSLPVVENLEIQTDSPLSALFFVFWSCIPKFITGDDDFMRSLCKMMKQENELEVSPVKEHLMRNYILEEVTTVERYVEPSFKRWKVSPSEKVIAGDLIPYKSKQLRFRLR